MKDFDDRLLEIAIKNIEIERTRLKDIDTKALGIITIVGILVTFLSKSVSLELLSASMSLKFLSTVLYILTNLSFLITILLCGLTIKVRKIEHLSTDFLMEDLKNENPERQIGGLIGTSASVEKSLSDTCDQKANNLRYAVYALGASIVLLISYSLLTIF
jgi:hypothetical protein